MEFSTKIPIPKSPFLIDYNSKVFSIGSCFAENIAEKFDYYKFQNLSNPFGILFHPVAIEKIFQKTISEEAFTENDLFFHNERWNSFFVHSSLSHRDSREMLLQLQQKQSESLSFLKSASHIFITFGTAWFYRKIETGAIVANCHKVPQKEFTKEILSVTEIEKSIRKITTLVRAVNPEVKIIFTISPVRHLKDGFVENQQSKARLITAVHNFSKEDNQTEYFPSYEIMMDELRDYRFYTEDMIHPNKVAVNYIWKRFSETYFSRDTFLVMEEIETIQRALHHKPFYPESEQHLKFTSQTDSKINSLQNKYPHIKFI
jgi:lysophospholipase L1-like esterase